MRLIEALRYEPPTCMAFVGAGGKTTALFRAAREIAAQSEQERLNETHTVLVSTTTHLGAWQADLADYAYQVSNLIDLEIVMERLPRGVVLITSEESNRRLGGLDEAMLGKLWRIAQKRQLPLLLEADGARGRPLKAPAGYEPANPEFTQLVVVVAGMAGLGQPLTSEWVHRENTFASLTGLSPGEKITSEAVIKLLLSKEGGLKNIPNDARRVVLFNQADTAELRSQAQAMAGALLSGYDACIIASLAKNQAGKSQSVVQVVEQGSQVYSVIEPIAGIILAAGGSSRFGQPKQLLAWKGQPMVRQVALTALQAGLSPVVAVIGASGDEVMPVIEDLPVRIVNNPEWLVGLSSSIRAGIGSLTGNIGGAVFMQADQPHIPPALIARLIESHQTCLKAIVAPQIDGRHGNPVLFDRCTFPALQELEGDIGGRALFADFLVEWVSWDDPRCLLDIDTPHDYQTLLELYARGEVQS